MKKNLMALFAIVTVACSVAFAADQKIDNQKGYFSNQHPLKNMTLVLPGVAPTDIIINNATFNTMYVTVPAGNFTDAIFPRGYDHILNYNGAYVTRLVLKGPDGFPFLDAFFCPHASITVFGYSAAEVVVDTKSC